MKITKRQLIKIIREQTSGVEDASFSADAFGGGEEDAEAFVDVEEESLLNQNEQSPEAAGVVKDIDIIPERKDLKRKIRQIINEQRNELKDFRVTVVVRVPARSVEYVLNSIEDGMEFDEEVGEGILSYDVQEIPYMG